LFGYLFGTFLNGFYFGSRQYARVVVFSKAPLPNYRPDLDDKRPQREVYNLFAISELVLLFVSGLLCKGW